jgi:dUTP pyrophosphatase
MVPITNVNDIAVVIVKKGREHTCPFYGRNDVLFYPYEKAICQAILLPVPKMKSVEISVEELKAIPSERGEGKIGSSGK